MQYGSLEYVNYSSTQVIQSIRLAYEGATGRAFVALLYHFDIYSKDTQIDQNKSVQDLIKIMSSAYEKQDMLFVADILEYELMPLINKLSQ